MSHGSTHVVIGGVFTGRPAPLARGEASAILKEARTGRVALGPMGLDGDEQADPIHHGGPEQALHFYPVEHYAYWRERLPEVAARFEPGSFGENLSAPGLSENGVLIGDRWLVGDALVEVSQGRQPCWKIDARFDVRGLTAAVLATGRSGWYFRVVEAGAVGAGDGMRLVDRPDHGWNVAAVTRIVLGRATRAELLAVAGLAALSPKWRERAARRAAATA